MRDYLNVKLNIFIAFWGAFASVAILGLIPVSRGEDDGGKTFKPVVLVPPFENQTKQHEQINLEVATSNDPKNPKRSFKVDRYTEAPRTLFENTLSNIKGVTIVERQRVDQLLVEAQFGETSGLVVDPEKAIKLGKLIGANLIVIGTLADLSEETKSFKGYGVETQNVAVTSQIRFRVLDETGKVLFSKLVKGTKSYTKTNFGETKSNDRNFAAIQVALEKIGEDTEFRDALLSKKAKADVDGLIQIEFAPKPDNCDIEIDGKYVGGSPLKRSLKSGVEYKVRISKGGYKEWSGTISPEVGLKITRELEPNR